MENVAQRRKHTRYECAGLEFMCVCKFFGCTCNLFAAALTTVFTFPSDALPLKRCSSPGGSLGAEHADLAKQAQEEEDGSCISSFHSVVVESMCTNLEYQVGCSRLAERETHERSLGLASWVPSSFGHAVRIGLGSGLKEKEPTMLDGAHAPGISSYARARIRTRRAHIRTHSQVKHVEHGVSSLQQVLDNMSENMPRELEHQVCRAT